MKNSKKKKRGQTERYRFSKSAQADALILCVPTPLNRYREPDLGFIRKTMEELIPYLRPGQVLSLESTTYPGTTEEELRPLIENKGLKMAKIFSSYIHQSVKIQGIRNTTLQQYQRLWEDLLKHVRR